MKEILSRAKERVTKCRVCPICNGAACAGEVPGMGGIGTGSSFKNNVKALENIKLVIRSMNPAANMPDCELDFFGRKLALPIIAAPIGNVPVNLGGMPTEQYTDYLIKGCIESGTLASIGDLPGADNFQKTMDAIKGRGEFVIPFIKPWDYEDVVKRLEIAAQAGCRFCGTDVDSVGLPAMYNAQPPIRIWTPDDLSKIIEKAHGLGMKYILKGIMSPDEAFGAIQCGADAIIISNHGGRVLDFTPGAADVLEPIAKTAGAKIMVMADGGVRSGADVLKLLALGAKAVLICRPISLAIHGDEQNGVKKYFETMKRELISAMRMTGCKNLAAITGRILH